MKIGILEWNTELIIDSLQIELNKLGHETKKFTIPKDIGPEIIEKIKNHSCDFWITHCYYVFDLWKYGNELESHFELKNIPVMSWYWENPLCSGSFKWLKRFQAGEIPKNICFLAVDSEHVQLFRQQKLNSFYLPIAIDDRLFEYRCPPIIAEKWQLPLAYVGMPCNQMQMEVDSLGEMLDAYINLFFLELFDRMKSNFKEEMEDAAKVSAVIQKVGMPLLLFFSKIYSQADDYLQAKRGFFQTAKMFLSDSWMQSLQELSGRLDFVYSWYQLHYYIYNLVEEKDLGAALKVFGGDAWKDFLLPHYSDKTPKLSEEDLLACFSQSKIQFCHTKWQFRHAVHERPLKVLAVRGFPLTDLRSDTAELIGTSNIATYSSLDEAKDKIRFYLHHEDARKALASRGFETVWSNHRMSIRARALLDIAQNFIGISK